RISRVAADSADDPDGHGHPGHLRYPRPLRRHIFQKPLRRDLTAQPQIPCTLEHGRTKGSKLRPRGGVIVEKRDLIRGSSTADPPCKQFMNLANRIPRPDSLLRNFPNVR